MLVGPCDMLMHCADGGEQAWNGDASHPYNGATETSVLVNLSTVQMQSSGSVLLDTGSV